MVCVEVKGSKRVGILLEQKEVSRAMEGEVDEFGVAVNGDTGRDGVAVLKLSASTSGHCIESRRVGGKCA